MVEPTHLKNLLVKIGNLPQVGVKIKIYLKPPPSKILRVHQPTWRIWSTRDDSETRKVVHLLEPSGRAVDADGLTAGGVWKEGDFLGPWCLTSYSSIANTNDCKKLEVIYHPWKSPTGGLDGHLEMEISRNKNHPLRSVSIPNNFFRFSIPVAFRVRPDLAFSNCSTAEVVETFFRTWGGGKVKDSMLSNKYPPGN